MTKLEGQLESQGLVHRSTACTGNVFGAPKRKLPKREWLPATTGCKTLSGRKGDDSMRGKISSRKRAVDSM